MQTIPMQVLIVELDNGRRGVFFGVPLVDDSSSSDAQIESVWFSSVNELPNTANFEQISRLAEEYFQDHSGYLH